MEEWLRVVERISNSTNQHLYGGAEEYENTFGGLRMVL
jgi:hypothetical protein